MPKLMIVVSVILILVVVIVAFYYFFKDSESGLLTEEQQWANAKAIYLSEKLFFEQGVQYFSAIHPDETKRGKLLSIKGREEKDIIPITRLVIIKILRDVQFALLEDPG